MENKPIANYVYQDGKLLTASFDVGSLIWAAPLDYVYKCELSVDGYLRVWNLDDKLLFDHEFKIEKDEEVVDYILRAQDGIINIIDGMFGASEYE